ncbi:class I SAM-dependent methyltransferase [Frondihabitans australicus]|uniref:16S rRNA m(2)G 1207 methyltransferase n=1 Tax=Frondihabitans australicus TaxID=386892 RepID=A0A495IER8_9MICO|nr:methyltransferase [Frondihabitans australicus]RKR74482.1 16S rRNA m(2)G 1207 methyltransferase [Frondihabitans australicus]
MASEHYFSSKPQSELKPREITVELAGRTLSLATAAGVFSPGRIDPGTAVLLAGMPTPPRDGTFLDVGCGWGPIALTLALLSPDATVWAVDVNERVLDLLRENAQRAGIANIRVALPDDVPDDVVFDGIWSNPPIRVGKTVLHEILEKWLPRLGIDMEAYLVVAKNLGADSLQKWINEELAGVVEVERESTSKGYRTLRATRL